MSSQIVLFGHGSFSPVATGKNALTLDLPGSEMSSKYYLAAYGGCRG